MEVLERLKKIAEMLPEEIGAEEKQFVQDQAAGAGVKINVRRNCKNCYIDAAVQIYDKLKRRAEGEEAQAESEAPTESEKQAESETPTESEKPKPLRLRAGVDVFYLGMRINAATSQEDLQKIKAQGFPAHFFE